MSRTPLPVLEYRDFSLEIHKQAGASGQPFKATIELTYACNLHCVHCYTDCYNQPDLIKQKEMSVDQVKGILDQLHAEGVLWLCFTGGEIFMRRDFLEIYRYARSKGFLITLFTNGTLFTEDTVRFLSEHPPFCIETSCHGATDETFDRITQVAGSFKRFIEGMKLLKTYALPVKVKTKAMRLNKHELDQVKALIERLGLQFQVSTVIYPRLDGDLTPTHHRLTPDEIVELECSLGESEPDESCSAQDESTVLESPPDDRLFRCGCATVSAHINAWGHLGACTWVNEPRADLRQHTIAQGIARVFQQIRGATYETDSPCRTCVVHRLCDKMPANAAAESGHIEQPVAHFCETAQKRAGMSPERLQVVEGGPRL